MSLKQKALSAFILVTFSTYFWKLIDFLATIVLARILTPSDFGVVSTALIIIFFLQLFPGFGTEQALIQRKKDVQKASDTVFILAPVLTVFIFIVMYFLSPLIAEFYSAPELTGMLRVLSFALFFGSFSIIPESLLEKELVYWKRIIPEVVSPVLMSIVSVALALRGYGAWSIIWGYFFMYLSQSVIVWFFSPYRPHLDFDWKIAKELLSFGKGVVYFYSVVFIIQNLSYGIVAKALGLAIVGYFAIADKFSTLVVKNITKIMNRITLPVFSKMQDSPDMLRKNFTGIVEFTSFIVIPANIALFMLAHEVIIILYGSKWDPAVPILQIVIFSGILQGIAGTTNSVFFSLGKHHILTRINFIQMVLLLVLLYPAAVIYGISGVAFLIVASSFVNFIMSFIAMKYMIKLDLARMSRELLYIPVATAFMAIAMGIAKEFIAVDSLIALALICILGLAAYLSCIFVLNKGFYKRIIRETYMYAREKKLFAAKE